MSQNAWCKFLNCHRYEIIKEEELKEAHGNVVGKVIISRCTNCGKISRKIIYTETGYER